MRRRSVNFASKLLSVESLESVYRETVLFLDHLTYRGRSVVVVVRLLQLKTSHGNVGCCPLQFLHGPMELRRNRRLFAPCLPSQLSVEAAVL